MLEKEMSCARFEFVVIGNLTIENSPCLPYNKKPENRDKVVVYHVPTLKPIVTEVELSTPKHSVKVSGMVWGEIGYERLLRLRSLCETHQAFFWKTEEAGTWLVRVLEPLVIKERVDIAETYSFELMLQAYDRVQ